MTIRFLPVFLLKQSTTLSLPTLTVLPPIHFSVSIRRTSDASIHIDLCFRRPQFLARVHLRNDVESQSSQEPSAPLDFVSLAVRVPSNDAVQGSTTTDDAISQVTVLVTEARIRVSSPSHSHNPVSQRSVTRGGCAERNLRNLPRGGQCWRGNDTDYQFGCGCGLPRRPLSSRWRPASRCLPPWRAAPAEPVQPVPCPILGQCEPLQSHHSPNPDPCSVGVFVPRDSANPTPVSTSPSSSSPASASGKSSWPLAFPSSGRWRCLDRERGGA